MQKGSSKVLLTRTGVYQTEIESTCTLIPEQFTVEAQEPLIHTRLHKMVAFMEAAIFNCQCDQMQNCEGDCEPFITALT